MSLPAGTKGFSHPPKGLAGLPGRTIAWRQGLQLHEETLPGVENLGALSHIRTALGDGRVHEQAWPRPRITTEREAEADAVGGIIWFEPPTPYADVEQTRLIAAAEAVNGYGHYSLKALFHFVLLGTLGKDSGSVCTSDAAMLEWIARRVDVSGCGQPWNCTLRTWITFLRAAGWKRVGAP